MDRRCGLSRQRLELEDVALLTQAVLELSDVIGVIDETAKAGFVPKRSCRQQRVDGTIARALRVDRTRELRA